MKTSIFLKSVLPALALCVAGIMTSCDKDDDDNNPPNQMYTISGNASGSQEVPAVTTTATGTLTGSYNATSNLLTYTISWNGLSGNITSANFYGPALSGVSAGSINNITIGTNGITGSTSGTITLADSTESHLLAGKLYYNLLTAAHTTGEIRGQVVATPN